MSEAARSAAAKTAARREDSAAADDGAADPADAATGVGPGQLSAIGGIDALPFRASVKSRRPFAQDSPADGPNGVEWDAAAPPSPEPAPSGGAEESVHRAQSRTVPLSEAVEPPAAGEQSLAESSAAAARPGSPCSTRSASCGPVALAHAVDPQPRQQPLRAEQSAAAAARPEAGNPPDSVAEGPPDAAAAPAGAAPAAGNCAVEPRLAGDRSTGATRQA